MVIGFRFSRAMLFWSKILCLAILADLIKVVLIHRQDPDQTQQVSLCDLSGLAG